MVRFSPSAGVDSDYFNRGGVGGEGGVIEYFHVTYLLEPWWGMKGEILHFGYATLLNKPFL